jgi:hypothetical protein
MIKLLKILFLEQKIARVNFAGNARKKLLHNNALYLAADDTTEPVKANLVSSKKCIH